MARYVVHVRSPMSPADAFAYMADLRNFAEWDPGVGEVTQLVGTGPGPGTSFDVGVKLPVGTMTLRYDTVAYDEVGGTATVFAENLLFSSTDMIRVAPDGDGSIVTYDAMLKLRGLFGLYDPFLGLSFNQIGDRAARGLIEALDGERAAEPFGSAAA